MTLTITVESPVIETPRTAQVRGLFDLAPEQTSKLVWQVDLPDGYRLRYFVEEERRTVHVVYLGPHPDGDQDGRERTARAGARRRQSGEVRE